MDTHGTAGDVRYFEDYAPGLVVECGTVTIDEDAIVAFAKQFDPQEFHTDRERAAQGPFGGLIASGWHTASLMTRLFVTRYLSGASSLGSPGIDELRWTAPVRPGDALSVRVTVLEARRSRSKPDRGLIHSLVEIRNQHAALVLTMKLMNLIRCRKPQ
jgi:acyl dehydratase